MTTVKAILTKPLDGDPEGTLREFDAPDFERLRSQGAVRAADGETAKMAGAPLNKMAPSPRNKDVGRAAKPKIAG